MIPAGRANALSAVSIFMYVRYTRRNRLLTAPALLLGCLATGRAEELCSRCHPSEVAAFERSPMGRSVGPPSVFAEGRIVDKLSESTPVSNRYTPELNRLNDEFASVRS